MTKSRQKRRALRSILIFIALLVLIAIIGCGGAYVMGWQMTGEPNPANWSIFKGGDAPDEPAETYETSLIVYDNAVIGAGGERYALEDTYDMPTCLAFAYSNNTSLTDGTSVTLTAIVTPENATDKRVKWTSSDPEYVSVTPAADDSTTATVTYIQGFNEPVIITCTSLDSPQHSATCRVDCLAVPKANDVIIDVSDSAGNSCNTIQLGKSYDITSTMDMLAGTYFPELEFVEMSVNMTGELCNDVAGLLGVDYLDDMSYDGITTPVLSLPSSPWSAFGCGDYSVNDFNSAFCRAVKNGVSGDYDNAALSVSVAFNLKFNGTVIDTLYVTRNVGCDVSNIWVNVDGVETDKDNIVLG